MEQSNAIMKLLKIFQVKNKGFEFADVYLQKH